MLCGHVVSIDISWVRVETKPHNGLPPLPPGTDLETRAVLKACINARTALAELKQAAGLIPNQTMLINTG